MINIDEGFSVEIESRCDHFWRYNLAVTCGCFERGAGGEDGSELHIGSEVYRRKDFVAAEDFVAPVGANMECCPEDCPSSRGVKFETVPCDCLKMYVYVIPHSLPVDCRISDFPPFDLHIRVMRGRATIHDELHKVNAWSGASIELLVPKI